VPPNPSTPTLWQRWKLPSGLIGPSQICPPPHGVQPAEHPAFAGAAKTIPAAPKTPIANATSAFISSLFLAIPVQATGTKTTSRCYSKVMPS
jgi:hypothetical protein